MSARKGFGLGLRVNVLCMLPGLLAYSREGAGLSLQRGRFQLDDVGFGEFELWAGNWVSFCGGAGGSGFRIQEGLGFKKGPGELGSLNKPSYIYAYSWVD